MADLAISAANTGQGLGFLDVTPEELEAPLHVLLKGLPLARRARVVDVGANPNVAEAPYLALMKQGLCDVVGFEPHPGAFADLEKIKGPRETYFPYAVGDGSTKELKVYRMHGFTSVHEPAEAAKSLIHIKNWHEIESRIGFDTVRLDDTAEVPRFDLLKIDIQGGEGDVFRGAEARLKTACAVIVELRYFALYAEEPMMAGIDVQLRGLGFQLHKLLPSSSFALTNSQMHRLNRKRLRDQVVDGDAVYIRDLTMLPGCDDEQVAHLALLAATVIGSHTLVLFCLDELAARGAVAQDLPRAYADALPAFFQDSGPKKPRAQKGRVKP